MLARFDVDVCFFHATLPHQWPRFEGSGENEAAAAAPSEAAATPLADRCGIAPIIFLSRILHSSISLNSDHYKSLRIFFTPSARLGVIGGERRRWRRAFDPDNVVTNSIIVIELLLLLPAWHGPGRRSRHSRRGPLCGDEAVDR